MAPPTATDTGGTLRGVVITGDRTHRPTDHRAGHGATRGPATNPDLIGIGLAIRQILAKGVPVDILHIDDHPVLAAPLARAAHNQYQQRPTIAKYNPVRIRSYLLVGGGRPLSPRSLQRLAPRRG